MQETSGALRGVRAHGAGSMTLTRLRTRRPEASARFETARAEFVKLHDRASRDQTQARVPVPQPVAPQGALQLDIGFRARLPPLFARAGFAGDFHVIAQWFPKLARLQKDGSWATFPYHGNGEFFADFANYEVTLIAPKAFRIAATGKEVSVRSRGQTVERRFEARRVHDFAIVAAPWFQKRAAHAKNTSLMLYYPPGYRPAAERHRRITTAALEYFERLYGAYPYETLTVVVPPRGAEGGAAMEYPTLFLTAGPWFPLRGVHLGMHDDVTVHELAHQWFQGLIATHEVEWPMLDEGLTTWAAMDFLRARYGRDRSGIGMPGVALDAFELARVYALRADTPPPGRPAYAFTANEYGRSVYARTALVLETVARTWGRQRMHRMLGRYARAHRFSHPSPDDLFRAADAEYGHGFARRILRPALLDGETASMSIKLTGPRRAIAKRTGKLPLPTRVRVRFVDGSRSDRAWPGSQPRLTITSKRPIRSVLVDPHRHNLLDRSRVDNGARRKPAALGTRQSWWAHALSLFQVAFGAFGP